MRWGQCSGRRIHERSDRLWARLRVCKTDRILLYEGCTIGHKHIAVLPMLAASRIELEILESDGAPCITAMTAHCYKTRRY